MLVLQNCVNCATNSSCYCLSLSSTQLLHAKLAGATTRRPITMLNQTTRVAMTKEPLGAVLMRHAVAMKQIIIIVCLHGYQFWMIFLESGSSLVPTNHLQKQWQRSRVDCCLKMLRFEAPFKNMISAKFRVIVPWIQIQQMPSQGHQNLLESAINAGRSHDWPIFSC